MHQIFKENEIPVTELDRVGLLKDGQPMLRDEDLNALLSGGITRTLHLRNFEEDDIKISLLDAKLSMQRNEKGQIELLYHPVYREHTRPDYLTEDEAEKLIDGETVNLDKVIKIDGQEKEVLIEFDKDTKEFVITDIEGIIAPDFVNNEALTAEQKLKFKKGKEVELSDGTKFRFTNTDSNGLRSNKLHLVVSLLLDGGMSYMLYKGLKALGPKEPKVSEDYSRGYYNALEDMKVRPVKERISGSNVQSR
jgi:hypothetical protein